LKKKNKASNRWRFFSGALTRRAISCLTKDLIKEYNKSAKIGDKKMFIKDIKNCEEIVAGDETTLKEILHPLKDELKIRYSIAHAVVKPGKKTLWHRMKASEVYYILQGNGLMHIDDETKEVESGHVIYIPPNSKQRISNTGNQDLIFLCIADPAWRKEDEEILEK